jgi:uncharacterized protein YqkB
MPSGIARTIISNTATMTNNTYSIAINASMMIIISPHIIYFILDELTIPMNNTHEIYIAKSDPICLKITK